MSKVKLQIAALRKQKGLTQTQLASILGVTFQTISKWETGITYPDILLLPRIAEFFDVSVDEVLGLSKNETKYISKGTSNKCYWNPKSEYLSHSRSLLWNDDYLAFLVKSVWQITQPVSVMDYGCGSGFLYRKLMPFLPQGSTYTGIDFSEELLSEAKQIEHIGYQAEFILADINVYESMLQYDIVICQALLRHQPNPLEMLNKMVNTTKSNGMVICVEVNRNIEQSALAICDYDFLGFEESAILQKIWKTEYKTEGRDYSIGFKVPFLMSELGLYDIDARINDRVNYLTPRSHREELKKFLVAQGYLEKLTEEAKESLVKSLQTRGITKNEAEQFIQSRDSIRAFIEGKSEAVEILHSYGMVISYGRKR